MSDHAVPNLSDHAGVRVPPPLIYVAIFAVGLLLHLIAPLTFLPRLPARVAALIFLGGWLLLFGWSYRLFRRTRNSLVTVRPAAELVVSGPYRFTRNPMYLSLLCLYGAVALWFGIIWAIILLPLVVLVVQRTVIAREERYLERRFGEAYRQYRGQVRRWI